MNNKMFFVKTMLPLYVSRTNHYNIWQPKIHYQCVIRVHNSLSNISEMDY